MIPNLPKGLFETLFILAMVGILLSFAALVCLVVYLCRHVSVGWA